MSVRLMTFKVFSEVSTLSLLEEDEEGVSSDIEACLLTFQV